MSIPNYKYKFYYDKKKEDFFDKDLYEFATADMIDKFFGNPEKRDKYYEALNRLKSHIKTERFSFKNSNNQIIDGEYQTISNYTNLSQDLKLLQLEGLKEKLEKTSKALSGDTSIYNGNREELRKDLKYIKTNNFAYNRNQATTESLRKLGKFGEIVRTDNKLLKPFLFIRNNVSVPINRFIGERVSKAYSQIFEKPTGLYDNKPTHRYSARRDYFYNKEKKKLEEQGKKINPFVLTLKARFNAIVKYKVGNEEILNAGKNSIKASIEKIQQTKYLEDKFKAVNEHIEYLKEKLFIITDEEEIQSIKKNLEECLNIRDEIRQSEFFDGENIKQEYLDQTDAISFNQHRNANKDNVTRVITGVKLAATAGIAYTGPKIREWILENTKIPVETERSIWIPGYYDKKTVEGHLENVFVPGYLKTETIKEEIINPRILKLFDISEDVANGLGVAELTNLIYENLRKDNSREKLEDFEKIVKQQETENINNKLREILSIEDVEERFGKINVFEDLDKLSEVNYIEIINSFLEKPELLLKLLKNNKFYSKENFKFILGNLLNSKLKNEIIQNEEYKDLLENIVKTNFEAKDIDFIINSYDRNNSVLKLFPKDGNNYLQNEELILRKTTTEFDEKVIDRLLYLKKINIKDRAKVKFRLKQLYNINDEILETVNFEMLTTRFNDLKDEMSVITLYPKLQEQICGLSNNEYEIFKKFLKDVRIDWIPLIEDLLENVSEYDELINKDTKFVKYIKNVDIHNEKSLEELIKIMQILSNPNRYNIKTFDEIMNFSRNELFDRYISTRQDEEGFKKLSEYEKIKDFILQRYLGQDFETAKRIYEMFGKDIEKIENTPEETEKDIEEYVEKIEKIDINDERFRYNVKRILDDNKITKKYLIALKSILEEDDYETLLELYRASKKEEIFYPTAMIESKLRGFFVRQKNKSLYMPRKDDKVTIDNEEVYLAGDEFNFQISSIESYAHDDWIFKKDDAKKVLDWDCKKVRSHGISSVFCGNKNLSLPPIHGVCYAFDSLAENSLLKSAPWDLGAWSYNKEFNILRSKSEFGTMFTFPETQLKYTLRRHNEDVIERRNLRYTRGKNYKLQPSYLVSFTEVPLNTYLKEVPEEVLTSEVLTRVIDWDKFGNEEYKISVNEQALKKDEKWKKTKRESRSKGLKKVVVDRTHTLIKERIKNDEKEKRLLNFNNSELNNTEKMSEFLQLMEDIIVEFDEVRAGTIQKEIKGWNSDGGSNYGDLLHKEAYEKLYSYKVMDDKLGKIEAKIKSLGKEKYELCMQKLKEISACQVEKISKSYWWYEYDTSHDWYHYYKYAGRELSGINFGKDKEIITSLLDKKIDESGKTGGERVYELINEIKNIHEYDIPESEPDWHGRKHINNVVLFSYLIAQNEESLGNDLELLLQAAKYHDVGRDGNWNGQGPGKRHDKDEIPHAHPSAMAAEFYLKKQVDKNGNRKYSDSQIAMIKVAIEYHEVYEKNKNTFNSEKFEKLCLKENVRDEDLEHTKLMCIYLKDADAVDRTRFLYEEKGKTIKEQKDNLDLRYLRTNTAIALRDFAREISNKNHENEEAGIRKIEIPDELLKYEIPEKADSEDWKKTQEEIRQFNMKFTKRKIDEEQLKKMSYVKKSSSSYFAGKRQEFKKFIDSIKNKFKKDER